ncbi:HIT family protein, partial [Campylobacter jejuni]|nr:HIT family protein [Campylobacter jejuni]
SFANYVPRVHFHVMARFKEDAFFPECMWGKQQRETIKLDLPKFEEFVKFLNSKIF